MKQEISSPSLIEQGLNFIEAVANHMANHLKRVPLEEFQKRLAICRDCMYFEDSFCKICGCLVTKKAWWDSEECPVQKWQ